VSLRCAFCHDTAAVEAASCPRCGTQLHVECWRDAAACPTLGCGVTRGAIDVMPGPPARPWPTWVLPLALVIIALVIVVPWARLGAPTIVVRNESGHRLTAVRLTGQCWDGDVVHVVASDAEALDPGQSMALHGPAAVGLTLDEVESREVPPIHCWIAHASPWRRSVFAITADGRLRTVSVDGIACTCPDGKPARNDGRCDVASHQPWR
jgi:hypothetical protein